MSPFWNSACLLIHGSNLGFLAAGSRSLAPRIQSNTRKSWVFNLLSSSTALPLEYCGFISLNHLANQTTHLIAKRPACGCILGDSWEVSCSHHAWPSSIVSPYGMGPHFRRGNSTSTHFALDLESVHRAALSSSATCAFGTAYQLASGPVSALLIVEIKTIVCLAFSCTWWGNLLAFILNPITALLGCTGFSMSLVNLLVVISLKPIH